MADERHPNGQEPVDLSESVAGEEDPGASVDLAVQSQASPGASAQPAGAAGAGATAPSVPMAAGDEAPAGTPGTGEDLCRACGGTGMMNGGPCPECEGLGKVTVGIGGA